MATGSEIFFRGMVLTLNIRDKVYQGQIVRYETDKEIVLKVMKADMTLTQVMINTEVTVRCIAEDGNAYGFKSRLKDRKIPLVTMTYPEGDLQGVNVRREERVPTSYWAVLKIMTVSGEDSQLEPLGDGNIVEMSTGGCKVMSQVALKRGDVLWVEFQYGEKEETVQLKGIVRNTRPAPYESTYYGLQFDGITEELKNKVEEILNNPQA